MSLNNLNFVALLVLGKVSKGSLYLKILQMSMSRGLAKGLKCFRDELYVKMVRLLGFKSFKGVFCVQMVYRVPSISRSRIECPMHLKDF